MNLFNVDLLVFSGHCTHILQTFDVAVAFKILIQSRSFKNKFCYSMRWDKANWFSLYYKKNPPKLRYYPKNIVFFSCALLVIGLSIYLFVQSYLPLPDIRTVYRRQSEFMTVKPNMLLSLSNVNEIIKQYIELCNNTNITSENKFVLAWDALDSPQFLYVNKNKTIKGLISKDICVQESF